MLVTLILLDWRRDTLILGPAILHTASVSLQIFRTEAQISSDASTNWTQI